MALVRFTCSVCGFYFIVEEHEVGKQNRLHKKAHDEFLYGIKTLPRESDVEITNEGGFRVILVSPRSPLSQRQMAERLAKRSRRDTRFDFSPYDATDVRRADHPLVFVGILDERAIGFSVFRRTSIGARISWDRYGKEKIEIPDLPSEQWAISMIWVLENKRKMGYASRVVDAAITYLNISAAAISWLVPFSDAGEGLARKFCPDEVTITTVTLR